MSLRTVQRWVHRAQDERLDRVDWSDRPAGNRSGRNRYASSLEDLVLQLRKRLKKSSDLGEYGAAAIHRALVEGTLRRVPSVRTIGRSLADLRRRSDRYVQASLQRSASRIQDAPRRRPFPKRWRFDLARPLTDQVIYLRRTNDRGELELLGHRYLVDQHWLHRLVRAEVDLDKHQIRFYRLRRREPNLQPLAKTVPYEPPSKPFQG